MRLFKKEGNNYTIDDGTPHNSKKVQFLKELLQSYIDTYLMVAQALYILIANG